MMMMNIHSMVSSSLLKIKDSFMTSFDYLWQLLDPPVGYHNMRSKCESVLWNGCSLYMQRRIYRIIRDRKTRGDPVNPNPWFAIVNARDAEPTNWNGSPYIDQIVKTTKLAVAWYRGRAGIYTLEEAKALNMRIERMFNN